MGHLIFDRFEVLAGSHHARRGMVGDNRWRGAEEHDINPEHQCQKHRPDRQIPDRIAHLGGFGCNGLGDRQDPLGRDGRASGLDDRQDCHPTGFACVPELLPDGLDLGIVGGSDGLGPSTRRGFDRFRHTDLRSYLVSGVEGRSSRGGGARVIGGAGGAGSFGSFGGLRGCRGG